MCGGGLTKCSPCRLGLAAVDLAHVLEHVVVLDSGHCNGNGFPSALSLVCNIQNVLKQSAGIGQANVYNSPEAVRIDAFGKVEYQPEFAALRCRLEQRFEDLSVLGDG